MGHVYVYVYSHIMGHVYINESQKNSRYIYYKGKKILNPPPLTKGEILTPPWTSASDKNLKKVGSWGGLYNELFSTLRRIYGEEGKFLAPLFCLGIVVDACKIAPKYAFYTRQRIFAR